MGPHPCATSNVPFCDRPAGRSVQGLEHVLFADMKTIDVVQKSVISLGNDRQTRVSGVTFAKPSFDVPLDDGVTHDADAVRIGDQDGTAQTARFFKPSGSSHLAISVQVTPGSEDSTTKFLALREDCGDSRS